MLEEETGQFFNIHIQMRSESLEIILNCEDHRKKVVLDKSFDETIYISGNGEITLAP